MISTGIDNRNGHGNYHTPYNAMNENRRATIKQVARLAGVSTQTVSRVLNNRPDVAPVTRQRIQQVIESIDYRPSALARSLIQQRSTTIGVVTAGLNDIGPSWTLNGITGMAEEMGYALLLKELPLYQQIQVEPVVESLLARHVDGLIWAVPEVGRNREWLETQAAEIPVPVFYLAMKPRGHLPMADYNNYLGGIMAATHLLDQGYRHIAHISGPLDYWAAHQRKAGWQAALQEAGLRCSDESCVAGDWSTASGVQAYERLRQQYPEIDAVFAANDQMALGVLHSAWNAGCRLPAQLGVVGYDNVPESNFYCPPLTTISQNLYALGRLAVGQLIALIESRRAGYPLPEPGTILLDPQLVVRQSTLREA